MTQMKMMKIALAQVNIMYLVSLFVTLYIKLCYVFGCDILFSIVLFPVDDDSDTTIIIICAIVGGVITAIIIVLIIIIIVLVKRRRKNVKIVIEQPLDNNQVQRFVKYLYIVTSRIFSFV